MEISVIELFEPILAAATTQGAAGHGEAIQSLLSTQALIALATLTVLEIVLGIDNIIFISVLADKLPKEQQNKARTLGLLLAMVLRVALLLCIGLIMRATTAIPVIGDWFTPIIGDGLPLNWRDAILLVGGLFLIYKATTEIHDKLEGQEHAHESKGKISFSSVIAQILILDIVFSLDSVITAIGMVQNPAGNQTAQLTVMIIAVAIAVGVMLFAAKPIAEFVNRHPTVKMLAFSFLILVGVVLVVDASHRHIPKGYIYFAMAFSVGVEMLNLKLRGHKGEPVKLHQQPTLPESASAGH
jgi:predicted tellurium resistance membrane protein TerC